MRFIEWFDLERVGGAGTTSAGLFCAQLARSANEFGLLPAYFATYHGWRLSRLRWTPIVGQFLGLIKVRPTARDTPPRSRAAVSY